jgi:predicted porin
MKKSLFALAAVTAFAGAAQAQSSVTVYGIVDMGIAGGNNRSATPAGVTKSTALGVQQSPQSTSRLGFRGTEDLGGGLSAFFTFETGLTPNDAVYSTSNNRQSFVGLGQKGVGRFALGTQYTPIHEVVGKTTAGQQNNIVGDLIYTVNGNAGLVAPGGAYGLSGGQSYTVRQSNALTLKSENIAGFTARAILTMAGQNRNQTGANAGGQNDASGYGLGLDYKWKKLFVTANYQSFTSKQTSATAGTDPTTAPSAFTIVGAGQAAVDGANVKDNQMYVAGSYNFGILTAYAGYINRKASAESNSGYFQRYTAQQIGVRGNVTKSIVTFASVGTGAWENTGYDSASAKINGYQLGANYLLSKRTNLYAIYGNVAQSNAANSTINPSTAGVTSYNQNNYAVGVRHTF